MRRMEWQLIDTVPRDRDVEIAVTNDAGMHALACQCRLTEHGWIAASSKRRLHWVRPTHWRDWFSKVAPKPERDEPLPAASF